MFHYIIPDQLAMFFNVPVGTIMTRLEITDILYDIIVDKGLIDLSNPRRILPDDELRLLEKELTFFNLQSFLTQFCTQPVPPLAGYIPRPRTNSDEFEEVIVHEPTTMA